MVRSTSHDSGNHHNGDRIYRHCRGWRAADLGGGGVVIQIVASIILASGVSLTAKLPQPVFPDVPQCQSYLESEDFKADFAKLTDQVASAYKQEFKFKVSCEPSQEGRSI
jgi:hypothetical protein